MDKKRILFWACFIIILALIVWGVIASMNKSSGASNLNDAPALTAADHVEGNPNASVTLIEYGDFQCPACGFYAPLVERLFNESSSTMKLVFRHFPLTQHPNAIPAALASEAAAQQGKFWEMYTALYGTQSEWVDETDAHPVFDRYAKNLGLNLAQFHADEASSTLHDRINADQDGGIAIGINQTPTFFINGKVITNPQSYDQFKALIQAAASSTAY